jgi:hypothetical protein
MIFVIPKLSTKFIQVSSKVISFNLINGFGKSKVNGFNLFPKPAHKINAVLIFILTTD